MENATGIFGYVINGGRTSSTLEGSNFSDSISGNIGIDTLIGNRGNDTIEGGDGADFINAGRGVGLIKDAGNGADIITHDKGSALIVYNTGVDTVTITASRAGVYVAVNVAGVRSVDASTSDAAVTLDGRGAGENITTYTGGSGDDSIFGAALGDLLTGNDGNDTITGGLSADIINVGNGSNTVVFTNGLTADVISGYTADDIGSFDLSKLEMDDAVEENETLDFVTGSNISVSPGHTISMQTIDGAITLAPETNVLYYTQSSVPNAASLETQLEANGGLITTNGALAENDAFIIQYMDSDTNTFTYAVAHLEDTNVLASTKIAAWEVTDLATTDMSTAFDSDQFNFSATQVVQAYQTGQNNAKHDRLGKYLAKLFQSIGIVCQWF